MLLRLLPDWERGEGKKEVCVSDDDHFYCTMDDDVDGEGLGRSEEEEQKEK